MTRLQHLISAAEVRILKTSEQAEMVRLFWLRKDGETLVTLKKTVNQAYAAAKAYDRAGGLRNHDTMTALFDRLGSSDFKVLYAACK